MHFCTFWITICHPLALAFLDDLTWICYHYDGYKIVIFLFLLFFLHLLVGILLLRKGFLLPFPAFYFLFYQCWFTDF